MRLIKSDEQAHLCKVQTLQSECFISRYGRNRRKEDAITFRQELNASPGEVSVATRWYNREVRRGHSTCRKRDVHSHIGLTNREGLNVVLLEIKMGA